MSSGVVVERGRKHMDREKGEEGGEPGESQARWVVLGGGGEEDERLKGRVFDTVLVIRSL